MQEQNISSQESIAIISSMINKAKNQFSENGHLYLIWGWAVFTCSILQFVLLNIVQYDKHYIVWFSMWLVAIYQVIYLRREKRQKKIKTYTGEIIGFVWLAFFILMCLFGFLFSRLADAGTYYSFIDPAFLVLYGMPTFLSGVILKFRALVIGGIACWALSIVATFIVPEYHLLLLPVAMLIAWIIPGYMLRKKYKLETSGV